MWFTRDLYRDINAVVTSSNYVFLQTFCVNVYKKKKISHLFHLYQYLVGLN